jgi:signal peptidase I
MATGSIDRDSVQRELAERGYATVTVSGGCMEPALHDGEWVIVQRAREPQRGDVALLDCGGTLEIHRLGLHLGPWWLHKGDASPHWGIARRREILGVVGPRKQEA